MGSALWRLQSRPSAAATAAVPPGLTAGRATRAFGTGPTGDDIVLFFPYLALLSAT